MINDLCLAMFDCWVFHYPETITFAWFVTLWCHDVVRKDFFVHRRKAIVCDSHTMCSKITSSNLSVNINIFPVNNQS